MNLLADIGNSRIKWGYLSDNSIQDNGAVDYQISNLEELLHQYWQRLIRPEQVYISNVAGESVRQLVAEIVTKLWLKSPHFVIVDQEYRGLKNGYRDIGQLGVDRWLAMVAAWDNYQAPVCIVDCGTTITIDCVSGTGQHLGGLIVPGLEMMQTSLVKNTGDIDTNVHSSLLLEIGDSTSACVVNGAALAIISLIERIVSQIEIEQQGLCKVITGGYAELINRLLAYKFDYEPYLVLKGLALKASV